MKRFLPFVCFSTALVVTVGTSVADDQEKPDKKEKPKIEIRARPAIRLVAPGLTAARTSVYDPLSLVRNAKVKEEINLTDEQSIQIDELFAKLTAARREITAGLRGAAAEERQKKLVEIQKKMKVQSDDTNKEIEKALKPEQLARLEQISIQRQGLLALNNPKVSKKLKLTEEQLKKIAAVRSEGAKNRQQLIQDLRAGNLDRTQLAGKIKEIQQQTEKEVMEALTMEQQTRFEQMQGEKFEFGRSNARFLPVPAPAAIRLRIEAKPLERKRIQPAPEKKKGN
jgi:hypothetical protein